MKWEEIIRSVGLAGGAVLGYFGGWNDSLTLLVAVMVIDYMTGLAVAARGKSPKTESGGISSRVGLDGLFRKVFMFAIVMLAHVIDRVIGASIVQSATIYFFIANEGISITENAGLMGVKLPKILTKTLEVIKDDSEETPVPTNRLTKSEDASATQDTNASADKKEE